jgi:hypothetical protein
MNDGILVSWRSRMKCRKKDTFRKHKIFAEGVTEENRNHFVKNEEENVFFRYGLTVVCFDRKTVKSRH